MISLSVYIFSFFAFVSSFILATIPILAIHNLYKNYARKRILGLLKKSPTSKIVAFFHPYCDSGGGGERVLWTAIRCMLKKSDIAIVILTGDPKCLKNPDKVLSKVKDTFGLSFDEKKHTVHFQSICLQFLLEPSLYPVFTLAGQALGSIVVAVEAFIRCPVDIYIDTTGFAFTLPVFRLLSLRRIITAAYVHYPTVSSAMLSRLDLSASERDIDSQITYNNPKWVRTSKNFTRIKQVYYRFLVSAYGWAGNPSNCHLVLANSSWTRNHIKSLWGGSPSVLFPPCPTEFFSDYSVVDNEDVGRHKWIVSIGQFRPEKNHELQLKSFALFLEKLGISKCKDSPYRLILVGGCRSLRDHARVNHLRYISNQMNLSEMVEFRINLPYIEVVKLFKKATVNLHTMVEEHFGIGIVEGMAAGLITVAHNSGGPRYDIIGPTFQPTNDPVNDTSTGEIPEPKSLAYPNYLYASNCSYMSGTVGFLAGSAEEYANVFSHIFTIMRDSDLELMRSAAKHWTHSRFSEACFESGWLEAFDPIFT
ncbi:unnamed protein product [Protopolystoma xenopodis]|uniref:GDP-Man:Man(3)GlcNAc(2)-PP-Dol alpha-1,2-mannosyltransferase n=1 Tax=Protopolystoma xenopodis TaxID=117903 RepID=A0A3S4ZU07_9PLAT|nr:unnamed protein product [Protopolystoma xenopodis]